MLWHASAIQDEKSKKIIEEIPAPLIEYLVFEGGGIRGIGAYLGVLQSLGKYGVISLVKHVAGSSIGAVAALLIALGCDASEMAYFLQTLALEQFLEAKRPSKNFIKNPKTWFTILTADGFSLSSGQRFTEWLESVVEKKLGKKHATFADLAKLVEANPDKFKYLSVTGSNLTKNRLDIFSHEKSPDMPLATAVRISASFPCVFKPVEIKTIEEVEYKIKTAKGWTIEKRMEEVTNIYIDGGLMNNLPSFIFADEKYLPKGVGFTKTGANPALLNIKIDTEFEMRTVLWNCGYPQIIQKITEFFLKIADAAQSRDTEINEQYATNIIQVDDCGIDTLKFDISPAETAKLIASGNFAATEWLENHLSEAYQILVYENVAAWLASKDSKELAAIREAYKKQLREALEDLNNNPEREDISFLQRLENIKKLEEVIAWLPKYMHYQVDKLVLTYVPELVFLAHADLKIVKPRQALDDQIKTELNKKLQLVERKITLLEPQINDVRDKVEKNKSEGSLHSTQLFDFVVYLSKLNEDLNWLYEKRKELREKLRCKQTEVPKEIVSHAQERLLFHSYIKAQLANKKLAVGCQRNLVQLIDKQLFSGYVGYSTSENVPLSLDLTKADDFQIYIMAFLLYLKYIHGSDSLVRDVMVIYRSIFSTDAVPTNLYELGDILKKQNVDLLLSAYRIEGLITNFLRIDNAKQNNSVIDLDYIFKAIAPAAKISNMKIFQRDKATTNDNNEEPDNIEMDLVCRPFSNYYTDKFLMFHRATALKNSNQNRDIKLKHSDEEKHKTPRCMRRFEDGGV